MSTPILYKGPGTPEMYDDLMDFLNYVFGFDGDDRDFIKLLPKCYDPSCDPCHANYVVTEDGKLKAAVGAYDSELSVNGEILKCRGIGNVAVHPRSRSKGYMKDCMGMALRDMIADGVDYSALGGQRQRYQHFGYERAGEEYAISVDRGNTRRAFEGVPLPEYELRDVNAADTELIGKMQALHAARPMRSLRSPEKFFDISRSWRTSVTAVLKEGEFRGYFVGDLQELSLLDPSELPDVVRNYVKQRGDVTVRVPGWETATVAAITAFGNAPSLHMCEMINIFNYPHMIETLLRFKASRTELGDGVLSLFIHGFAGDVKVRVAVEKNAVTVEKTAAECDLELGHLEAISFLLGLFSPYREALKPAVRTWFPLPFYMENADHV